ncbi:MAG: DNA phosphorothioation-associated putative methyltransferase [Deltaproteobacteria bacterium]|nr:DNA phosphorothioation-associated putative methyltransferase [Kofleriaceae bacterium]
MKRIARHKTALRRHDFSRPVRIALADGLLNGETTFFDFGCGLGDDVRLLAERGIGAAGWDPSHAPDSPRIRSDVVNLGYVLNVIEDPHERRTVLQEAWALAGRILVVAARLAIEGPGGHDACFGDGYLTRTGTFQKYFEQGELRDLVADALSSSPVAVGPGVFYVFRDGAEREAFIASRYRRTIAAPKIRKSDQLFERHVEILRPLIEFVSARGRLPEADELPQYGDLSTAFGSVKRAFSVVRRVTGDSWVAVRQARSDDLLVYLALARFGGRPPISQFPRSLQLDIRSFFSSYTAACKRADEFMASAARAEYVDQLCRASSIGKETPAALYVHVSALDKLHPILRLIEGCARTYIGTNIGANILKFHRDKPSVSYLSYPSFDTEAHPALAGSLIVHLRGPHALFRDYSESDDPPILHRKEEFVPEDYPRRRTFERLTKQEEACGLYSNPATIGTRKSWERTLQREGRKLRGHVLVRR